MGNILASMKSDYSSTHQRETNPGSLAKERESFAKQTGIEVKKDSVRYVDGGYKNAKRGDDQYTPEQIDKAVGYSDAAYRGELGGELEGEVLGSAALGLTDLPENVTESGGLYRDSESGTDLLVAHDEDIGTVLAFRGTTPSDHRDVIADLRLPANHSNAELGPIKQMLPVMEAAARYAEKQGTPLTVTGHSLGGWAVNRMAEYSGELHPKFKSADYIAFSSPILSDKANVLNIGHENDPIYGLLSPTTHAGNLSGFLNGEPKHMQSVYSNESFGRFFKSVSAHELGSLNSVVDKIRSMA